MRVATRQTITEALRTWAVDRPHQEAVWSRGEGLRVSFGELADRIADRRRQLGAQIESLAPSAVALATGNRLAFLELFFALRELGSAVVTVDGSLPHRDKLDLCRRLGIGALLHCDREQAAAAEVSGERLVGDPVVYLSRVESPELVEPVDGSALIKLTSGSTGEPAGVCYDEHTLRIGIEQIGQGMELDERDRVLISIPLSHSYGFDSGLLSLAVLGTPLVLEPSIYPGALLRAIDEGEVTCLPLVPPLVRSLGQAVWPPCPRLRRVISAGGPLPAESACRFLRSSGRPVHNFYGSTETGGISFERRPADAAAAGTVGQPLPGVRVELDAERAVVVHSAANHLGHLGRDRRPIQRPVRTGDTGEWTSDGRLRLTGRSAEFLNIGGRKVATARLEELMRAARGVEDAAVVGLDDEVRGDRVIAFVVAEAWPPLLETLPNGLKPRQLRQVRSLPYNARGKLDRHRLRQMASEVCGG